jgi:hypothetical protein
MPEVSHEKMLAMIDINTVIRDHLRSEEDADMEDIDLLAELGKLISKKNGELQAKGEAISLDEVAESLIEFQNAMLGDDLTDEILERNLLRQSVLVEKLKRNIHRV